MNEDDYSLELITIIGAETHLHRGLECLLVLRGRLEIEIDSQPFSLGEDDLVVINQNLLHNVKGDGDNLLLLLTVGEKRLQRECGNLARCRLQCNGAAQDMQGDGIYFEMKRVMVNMFNIKLDKPLGYSLSLNMNLLRLLHMLYTTYIRADECSTEPNHTATEKPARQAILEYVDLNCSRPLTLKEAAAHFFLSPAYFSKYFKKLAGMGFLQYLQQARVQQSLPRLLYSDDSILQIAMDYGFTSAKAYSDNFARHYGEAPRAYRKSHRLQPRSSNMSYGSQVLIKDDSDSAEHLDFLRFVRRYEIQAGGTPAPVDENHRVDISQPMLRRLRQMENLLLIDKLETALYHDFFESLECKDRIGATYIYFQLLNYHMAPKKYGAFLFHQILESMNIIRRSGFVPFLRLDFTQDHFDGDDEDILQYLRERLGPILEMLSRNFSRNETRRWRFEIVCDSFGLRQAAFFYRCVRGLLHQFFYAPLVGLFATPEEDGTVGENFDQLLGGLKNQGMTPAFLTFHAFQNQVKRLSPADAAFLPKCANYHSDIASSVLLYCHRRGINPPLFMTAWNTMAGATSDEINVYVRGGLIMETLMELYNTVQGVGYVLAKRNTCPYSGERYGAPLNLYIFSRAKRPVYYVASIINRLNGELLYQGDHVAVVRSPEDELVVVVWNPQYINPAVCADVHLTDSLTRQIRVELHGLSSRVYDVKRFTVDLDSSGSLTHLQQAGYPEVSDRDTYEYLRDTPGGKMYYYTQKVDDGILTLQAPIQYNGVVMFTIK